MAAIADEAVVLWRWEFSETSQTVMLFTRGHGVIRGLAKGARREKAMFSGGFEPLTRGQAGAIVKPGRDLATLTEWRLEEVFRGPRRNLAAHHAGLYLADLVAHAITDHDPHGPLFDRLVEALRALDDAARTATVLLDFQWALLVETGYRPALRHDARLGTGGQAGAAVLGYCPAAGGVAPDPASARAPDGGPVWRVRADTIEVLEEAARGALEEPATWTASKRAATERAGALLALHLAVILGRDLPSREAVYGPLPDPW